MLAPGLPHRGRALPRLALRSLLVAAALWLLVPGIASAHAHLVQADPAPDGVIARAPSLATFVFDEPLNPALTRVRITDASGRTVTADSGHLAPGHDGELWELGLPRLVPGTYSVFWTSESATDGHIMSSFYTFRVASGGAADRPGAVTGAAAGAYGGGSGTTGLALDGGPIATALVHWVGLMAQALWLGALIVELFVLSWARRVVDTPMARLSWACASRLWRLVRGSLALLALSLIGEVLSLALQGTGGDWGRALAPATLGGLLSDQNGHTVVARLVVLAVALFVAVRAHAPAYSSATAWSTQPVQRHRHALGIVAPSPSLARPNWGPARAILAVLAALYMLLVAFAGHAADITPAPLSFAVDWAHLMGTAAWAGGIAALAVGVMPLRRRLSPQQRAAAVLSVLDRFSPVAYLSVAVLALSGLYNAVNHLDAPSLLANTLYGQLLVVKLVLVGLLMALSASHVFGLRRYLARAYRKEERDPHAAAAVHEGLATLAARLRLETGVGAAILLATALMGQTLPAHGVAAASTNTSNGTPAAISGAATVGDLRGQLTVTPPAVGSATFALSLWEKGQPITANSGAAIIHLYPAAQPSLRATLTPRAHGTQFSVRGSLPTTGTWHADVLVRTATVNTYRTLPFAFTVGAGATFLAPGINARAVTITADPGRISAPNTFTIAGLRGTGVRLLSQSLDMQMGVLTYVATSLGGGRWQVRNVYAPMNGRWGLTVQVQRAGAWLSVRRVVYEVPLSGPMRLLSSQGYGSSPTPAAAPGAATGAAILRGPYNVAFARTLPYTGFVTEMGSNGVRALNTGALLKTGLQAHGVDVLDGTPYAYVTNFGAEPGTVSQIDTRTMRVVRTFTVGLGPAHIVFTPDHRYAFVTDFRSSDLYRIDLASGATRPISFPGDNCFEPHGIDISEDGRTLYVACAGGAWIYTVSTRTLQPGRTVVTAPGAIGVAVDAPRHEVWVTNQTANSVTVLDERTLKTLATVSVGKGPALLVPTPDGRTVYVADQFGNTVSVIDAASRRVTATIAVAAQPHGPDVTADGKYVYVASIGGNAVTIIQTSDNKVVAVVPSAVGSNEVAIAH